MIYEKERLSNWLKNRYFEEKGSSEDLNNYYWIYLIKETSLIYGLAVRRKGETVWSEICTKIKISSSIIESLEKGNTFFIDKMVKQFEIKQRKFNLNKDFEN